ncbi:TM2 domain-containing protein [Sphingomonas sp. FW199]|uniref:TM2 domain-containing protein n=1 Tax=Sphingomonas sp. FW199 TaxID=3400217 RepID=UPI003CFA07CC
MLVDQREAAAMRGKILAFDYDRGEGFISGDDGVRYRFVPSQWRMQAHPVNGQTVDFEIADGMAHSIFAIASDNLLAGEKNKYIAAILAFFLGIFGAHKFYLGRIGTGVIMLLCGTIGWLLVVPGIAVSLIAFIEFIIYLAISEDDWQRKYVRGDKAWF